MPYSSFNYIFHVVAKVIPNLFSVSFDVNCKEVATCPNSEMGIIALLLGKKLQLVSNPRKIREKKLVTYESFYAACSNTKHCTAYDAICKILSSKRSGIIFDFDDDAEDRMERYLDNFWEYKIHK